MEQASAHIGGAVPLTVRLARLVWFECLFGAEPPFDDPADEPPGDEPAGPFVEVRYRLPSGGMAARFFRWPAERPSALDFVARQGRRSDVYCGVTARRRRFGGRRVVRHVHVLWVDCDTPEAKQALWRFRPQPSMIASSGTGLHGYWALWPAMGAEEAEAANRRLAHALGADVACADAARILRPPGTFNFKTDPPRLVELLHLEADVYTAGQVVAHVPDLPRPERRRASVARIERVGDPLLAIPAEVYVPALTGREVGRDGKARCPFHAGGEERTPSLHVYPEDRGWTCFGCVRGGTVIDFGAALYGLEPRGQGFHEIRRRLAADLLPSMRELEA